MRPLWSTASVPCDCDLGLQRFHRSDSHAIDADDCAAGPVDRLDDSCNRGAPPGCSSRTDRAAVGPGYGDVVARSAVGAAVRLSDDRPQRHGLLRAEPAGRPDVGAVPERADRHRHDFRFSGLRLPCEVTGIRAFLHTRNTGLLTPPISTDTVAEGSMNVNYHLVP